MKNLNFKNMQIYAHNNINIEYYKQLNKKVHTENITNKEGGCAGGLWIGRQIEPKRQRIVFYFFYFVYIYIFLLQIQFYFHIKQKIVFKLFLQQFSCAFHSGFFLSCIQVFTVLYIVKTKKKEERRKETLEEIVLYGKIYKS